MQCEYVIVTSRYMIFNKVKAYLLKYTTIISKVRLMMETVIFGRLCSSKYRKVASSRLSRLVAHSRIFKLFMKGKFDAPLAKKVQN